MVLVLGNESVILIAHDLFGHFLFHSADVIADSGFQSRMSQDMLDAVHGYAFKGKLRGGGMSQSM